MFLSYWAIYMTIDYGVYARGSRWPKFLERGSGEGWGTLSTGYFTHYSVFPLLWLKADVVFDWTSKSFSFQVNEGVREKENSERLEWIQNHVQCEGPLEVITINPINQSPFTASNSKDDFLTVLFHSNWSLTPLPAVWVPGNCCTVVK